MKTLPYPKVQEFEGGEIKRENCFHLCISKLSIISFTAFITKQSTLKDNSS